MIGIPSSPLPITITLAFGEVESSLVASIPFSLRIILVIEALNIRFAAALPSASILCFSASCLAFSIRNSYSKASCSWIYFLSIPSFMAKGRETSLTNTAFS